MNKYAIESLAPRVKTLSESLSAPISPGDVNEEKRANKLERWAHILQDRESGLMHVGFQETGRD